MLRINQLKLPVTHTQEQLEKKLIKTLKINRNDMKQYRIRKRSLDARKKPAETVKRQGCESIRRIIPGAGARLGRTS